MARRLTSDYLHKVLNYDPQSGSFAWRVDIPKRIKAGMPAGSVTNGKKSIVINGENHAAHRLAWFYVHGAWPDGYVVPTNGDFLDCRIDNLMVQTRGEVSARSRPRNQSSGVKGVSWKSRDRKWAASIHINYRQINLGTFDTIEDAAKAYDEARRNIPKPDEVTLQKRRAEVARIARLRRLYNSTFDQNGNSMWPTFKSFVDEVREPPSDGSIIVPIDASQPVGPGNFTWARRARHDKLTKEGRRAYSRDHRAANYDMHRRNGLRKSFGLELHEYQEMHDRQNGLCACCGQPERGLRGGFPIKLAVDHNHTTGEIRALLCGDCNKGIGYFREDPDRLRKAAAYLEHHAEKSRHQFAA